MHHCACLPTALSCPLPETTGITKVRELNNRPDAAARPLVLAFSPCRRQLERPKACKESASRQAYAYIVPRLPIVHAAAERVARAPATGFVAFTATTCLAWLA
ncbi:hypothetical protein SprV_0301206300 [Sparganum proliferum]